MNDQNAERSVLDLDRVDLDGHTIEELSDYLDAGRLPREASIEESAGCRIALDALERLRGLGAELLEEDAEDESATDEGWVQRILGGIARDARAGRRIPVACDAPGADLALTEGAVRGIVRAAEQDVPGTLIGRCALDGDVTVLGAGIRVRVEVTVVYGTPLASAAELLRAAIARRLATHTDLRIAAIDVRVRDVQMRSREEKRAGEPMPEGERS